MENQEILDYAQKIPLFKNLTSRDILAIAEVMVIREFRENETIVQMDDQQTQTFFIIASGNVNVSIITPEGKQTVLATLKRGDFFGEMSLLDGEPRSASVVAAETCKLFMLYRKPFMDILRKFPDITIQMLVGMSRRLRKSNKQINTLSLMSVYGRVADVILRLAKDQGRRMGNVIIVPDRPTHQMIADMAGTSRETVSRILSQLQKKQFIAMDRQKMVILDEEKLYY